MRPFASVGTRPTQRRRNRCTLPEFGYSWPPFPWRPVKERAPKSGPRYPVPPHASGRGNPGHRCAACFPIFKTRSNASTLARVRGATPVRPCAAATWDEPVADESKIRTRRSNSQRRQVRSRLEARLEVSVCLVLKPTRAPRGNPHVVPELNHSMLTMFGTAQRAPTVRCGRP
jgi:hypothetical protein